MSVSEDKIGILLAFLGGLGVSFSPCVYPLLPVLLGSIGSYIQNSKFRGFILSLIYVSGLALIYSILGIIAGITGSVFGVILIYPISRIVAGLIFIIFGLSVLEIFSFKTFFLKFPLSSSKIIYLKIFFMGISSALVISPCVSPILGSILLYVAMKRSLFYGWILLMAFAYGMGAILILGGSFSGLFLSLPKSGVWMKGIKKLSASILILIGIYFIITNIIELL